MAIHKLKPAFVEKVTRDGVYSDGGCLALKVRGASKVWVFRYARSRFGGKGATEMGLGPLHTIGLHDARELARQLRAQLRENIDPLEARKAEKEAQEREASKDKTFEFCAEEYFTRKLKLGEWTTTTYKGTKGRFENHVYPKLKNILISAVDHLQLERVLSPLWDDHPSTAIQVRKECEAILALAKAKNRRGGDNPASKDGPLGVLLPRPSSYTVKNHPSLPYQEVPAFMKELDNFKAVKTAAAMAILAACRT